MCCAELQHFTPQRRTARNQHVERPPCRDRPIIRNRANAVGHRRFSHKAPAHPQNASMHLLATIRPPDSCAASCAISHQLGPQLRQLVQGRPAAVDRVIHKIVQPLEFIQQFDRRDAQQRRRADRLWPDDALPPAADPIRSSAARRDACAAHAIGGQHIRTVGARRATVIRESMPLDGRYAAREARRTAPTATERRLPCAAANAIVPTATPDRRAAARFACDSIRRRRW